MDTSVGRGCSTLSGMICRSRFVCGGLAIGGMSIGAIASSSLAQGISQTPGCGCFCVIGAIGAAAHWCFPFFCGLAVQGFLCSPCVLCPYLSVYSFLWASQAFGSDGVGGQHCWKRDYPRRAFVHDVAEDLVCFLFFLLLQLATGL